MKFNAMQLDTFLRNIYYRRCVYLVFLVSVSIATPSRSTISGPAIKKERFPLAPEGLREINDHNNNENMDQDVAQPQFRHESTVNTKTQLHFKVESPEKFIWFIHNVIKILIKYNDKDLKDFFNVINTELDRYDKSEGYPLSRFLSSELNKVKNMSAAILRKQLLTIDASMEKEHQEKSQQQLTDYINSLYGSDYVKKFLIFMFNIDDYGFMITKNIDLESILKDGLKSVIFDHYNKLDYDSRETFISSIIKYFKFITKSPSLIDGNERAQDDEREFKLSSDNNEDHTTMKMKKTPDNITLQNIKVTDQSVQTHLRYGEPVNARGLLTNKATIRSKNTRLKSTASKHNVFIDIEYPTHLKVPGEHKIQRKRNKILLRTDTKYPRMSTTKNSTKGNENLRAESKYKSSRGKFSISAKRFNSTPHKEDYRRKINGNETADRFEMKRKILARLFQLENDIKFVKSQIDNDSRTIKNLQDQIHQKEKERAKLNLINDKKYIKEKDQIEEKYSSDQKAMRRNFQRHSLEKITERMKSNFSQFGKDDTESTSDKIYETQQNTSHYENIPDFIGVTPNIFDLLDDVKYETFENYDGEFDWDKFVTSNIYIQQLKNSTVDILDGRRMLEEEFTTPKFYPEEHPSIESLKGKPEFWNEYDMNEPRESTISTIPPHNLTLDHYVPQPGANKIVDSMGISLEIPDPLDMKKSDETEPKYDFSPNLRFDLVNRRRMLPDSQSMIPILETRGNIYTSTTTFDKILNDPIIRDIDKVVEF